MAVLHVLGLALAAFASWSFLSLQRNRRAGLATGLPTVSVSVFELNLAYYVFTSVPLVRSLLKSIPFVAEWSQYSRQSWRWYAKARLHEKHGRVFCIASPRKLSLEVADYDVVHQIVLNRAGFRKPGWLFDLVNIYGENVVTTEDAKWTRHRRFTQPAFGEDNNRTVWEATITQAVAMRRAWETVAGPLKSTGDDFRKLALHVISSAGYGMHIPFDASDSPPSSVADQPFDPNTATPPETNLSYFQAIRHVTHKFVEILILRRIWPLGLRSISPPSIRTSLDAYNDLGTYLRRLIYYHKSSQKDDRQASLMQIIVRGEASSQAESNPDPRYSLTVDEILGNAFIFTVAGHETTAVSMEYSLLLLAVYPERQAWFHRELDQNLAGASKDPAQWSYKEMFPRLRAPLCVMNETMRLYPPVIIIPRETADDCQSLVIDGRRHHFPAEVLVTLNTAALHYSPDYWGRNVNEFHPERWARSSDDKGSDVNPLCKVDTGPVAGYPDMYTPPKGMFMPFSEGVRACLGKKFAQVEFAVTLTLLLKDHVVELSCEDGMSPGAARANALRALEDSRLDSTLMLPRTVALQLKKRGI